MYLSKNITQYHLQIPAEFWVAVSIRYNYVWLMSNMTLIQRHLSTWHGPTTPPTKCQRWPNEWLLSGIPHIVTHLKEASSRKVLREPCAALPYDIHRRSGTNPSVIRASSLREAWRQTSKSLRSHQFCNVLRTPYKSWLIMLALP